MTGLMSEPVTAGPAGPAQRETSRPTALQARSLYRFFRAGDEETLALQGVDLAVEPGELVAVVGPAGSGKSTRLACLAGLDEPDGGAVTVAGERLSHRPERVRTLVRARHVGMLMPHANLVEHLTRAANVRLVQELAGRPGRRPPRDLLDRVGLLDRAHAYPSTLSGGEAARAGLAVAMANEPAVLLADEPTGELDSENEAVVLRLLLDAAERDTAVVVASHSPAVSAAASRVVRLEDGRVVS